MTMTDTSDNPTMQYFNRQPSHNNDIIIECRVNEEIPRNSNNNNNNNNNFNGLNYNTHAQLMTQSSFHQQDEGEDEVKRPMNSFLLWAKIMRKKYASKNPNMHNAEISKLLGKIWNSMTTKDKRPYVEQAEKLRVLHMRTYPNYRYAPKKRKERRNQRMISPEVAAALHNTLFDVNNIISEQIQQNHMFADNLKSYGYLRNALKQSQIRNPESFPNSRSRSPTSFALPANKINLSNSPNNLISSINSPVERLTHASEGDRKSISTKDSAIREMTVTESTTLHYRPGLNQYQDEKRQLTTKDNHTEYFSSSSSSSSDSSESEAEDMTPRSSSIGDEFSLYLRHTRTRSSVSSVAAEEKREPGVGEDDFWNDITDIITSGSL